MYQPRSWLNQFFGACLTILLAAIALTIAAHLLLAIWRVLAVAAAVVGSMAVGGTVLRHLLARSRYW
jgi:uncharacterized membrane protein YczE